MIVTTDRTELDIRRIGYVRDGAVARFVIPGESSVIEVEAAADGTVELVPDVLLRSQLHRKLQAALEAPLPGATIPL